MTVAQKKKKERKKCRKYIEYKAAKKMCVRHNTLYNVDQFLV